MSIDQDDARASFPAGIDRVLVSPNNGNSMRYHRPHPDDPSRPDCDAQLEDPEADWRAKTHPRHVVFLTKCGGCRWPDDTVLVSRYSHHCGAHIYHQPDPDKPGQARCSRATDPEPTTRRKARQRGLRECDWCTGNVHQPNRTNPRSLYQKLADPDVTDFDDLRADGGESA